MTHTLRNLLASFVLLASLPAHAQTVDELIEKNLTAHGGREKLKAVQSVKITGKMAMMGMEAPMTMQIQRPNSLRMELTMQGMQIVQAYDGEKAWAIVPFTGSTDPRVLSEEESQDFKLQADIDGLLMDYKEKGHKAEYAGKEDIDGTEMDKIKLTLKDGMEMFYYLDPDTGLELRMSGKRKKENTEISFEVNFGDFKKVGDLLFAYSMENKVNGQSMGQMTVESIELNPAMESSIFKMPAAASPATDSKEK